MLDDMKPNEYGLTLKQWFAYIRQQNELNGNHPVLCADHVRLLNA